MTNPENHGRRLEDKLPSEPLQWDTNQPLIDAAKAHLVHERAGAGVVPVPYTNPQQFIAIGTAMEIGGLLPEAFGASNAGKAAAAVRILLLELTTFDSKMVSGSHLARRATEILELQQAAALDDSQAYSAQVAIPDGVYFNLEADNFYSAAEQGMGTAFFRKWQARAAEFPSTRKQVLDGLAAPATGAEGAQQQTQTHVTPPTRGTGSQHEAGSSAWVSVDQRLPEEGLCVLVHARDWERPHVAAYFGGDEPHWQDEEGDDVHEGPMYWQPLPQLPDEWPASRGRAQGGNTSEEIGDEYFAIEDGVAFVHPEYGSGTFFTDDCKRVAESVAAPDEALPISRSTYGSLEECEREQARRNAAKSSAAAPADTLEAHRAVIEEAAQVLESAAAHNRAKGRTVLERTQQDRADRLRLIFATHQPSAQEGGAA